MKTKTYELTEIEVFALKMATEEYYHQIKNRTPISPLIKRMFATVKVLKDQFKDDYRLWK